MFSAKYKAVIADMDGTLYFQTPMRMHMMCSILLFCLTHPFKAKEILLIRKYRKLYAKGMDHTGRCSVLSEEFGLDKTRVEKIIQKWMIDHPLRYVRRFNDKDLLVVLNNLKSRGYKTIVYSDYPVSAKLEALDFMPDAAYSADDVGCLKPSPEGLLGICEKHGLDVKKCFFIGDKYEKDGKCAENAGMEYMILPQRKFKRRKFYGILDTGFCLKQ